MACGKLISDKNRPTVDGLQTDVSLEWSSGSRNCEPGDWRGNAYRQNDMCCCTCYCHSFVWGVYLQTEPEEMIYAQ